ncbi:MAG TPA: AI-2E family transporter [Nitrospirales bacterium]|nr:AI-2E family transporter [Nitrospirales bacterium]
MTRQQLVAFGFFGVLLVLLYQLAEVFSLFLRPLLWAVILAHVTFPLHTRLTGLLRGREVASAALLTVGIVALIVAPVVIFTFLLVQEAGNGYDAVNTWVQSGGVKRLPDELAKLPLLGGSRAQHMIHKLVGSKANVEAFLLQSAKAMSGFIVEQLTGLVKNAFLMAVNFLVIVITLFFCFKDGKRLFQTFYQMIPLDEAHKEKIFSRLDQTITAVVEGIVITAIVQGLLAGLAYAVLDVPFPVFLMALTIVLAPLPFGGTALVWGPVALYLFWTGPLWKAIAMLLWGAGVVTMADNVLRPMLIGKKAELPVVFLFFSILGGLAAYGLIGLFLGPILLAILLSVIQIYREGYLTESPPPPMTA